MADFGRIRLHNNGHQLHGKFAVLHQFNLKTTRSWGVRVAPEDQATTRSNMPPARPMYLVLDADTKKNDKAQEPDYRRALKKHQNYLTGPTDD
jgi:hypothetical protein